MEIVTTIAPIALALLMLGLGLGLTPADFKRVVDHPKDFVGFVCQLILLPIIAFALIATISSVIFTLCNSQSDNERASHAPEHKLLLRKVSPHNNDNISPQSPSSNNYGTL